MKSGRRALPLNLLLHAKDGPHAPSRPICACFWTMSRYQCACWRICECKGPSGSEDARVRASEISEGSCERCDRTALTSGIESCATAHSRRPHGRYAALTTDSSAGSLTTPHSSRCRMRATCTSSVSGARLRKSRASSVCQRCGSFPPSRRRLHELTVSMACSNGSANSGVATAPRCGIRSRYTSAVQTQASRFI